MADRRMCSRKIINSARFLKMPPSTQALYFHLVMAADDDGVVEAFSVMRLTGCTEDELKILHAKGFVRVLNEELVSYITDWNEHNLIRADRKVDSIYKELLLQIVPDVQLLEARPRTDNAKRSAKRANARAASVTKNPENDGGRPPDDQWTTGGQPEDGIREVKLSQVKLSQGSLGEDSLPKEKSNNALALQDARESVISTVINAWNQLGLTQVRAVPETRKRNITARVKDYGLDTVVHVIETVPQSDFLMGRVTDFKCSFDWIIGPKNFVKVFEGNYVNSDKPKAQKPGTYAVPDGAPETTNPFFAKYMREQARKAEEAQTIEADYVVMEG